MHKYEIERLIKVLTGVIPASQLSRDEFYKNDIAEDSPLNDPIQIRLLLNARDKHLGMQEAIGKQKELIANLYNQCNELAGYKERAAGLDAVNVNLQNEVNQLKTEIDEIRACCMSPQMKNYDFLKVILVIYLIKIGCTFH